MFGRKRNRDASEDAGPYPSLYVYPLVSGGLLAGRDTAASVAPVKDKKLGTARV